MSKLKDFLVDLASDAKLMEKYRLDPKGTMKAHGVSDEEVDAIMNDDKDALKKATGGEEFKGFIAISTPNDEK